MERLSDNAIAIVNELHTERLSYDSEYVPIIDALNSLAAYEDTGLEPEEIQEAVDLFKDWKDADIPKELKSWVERCTWHVRKCEELRRELDEYKKAESEGRLVLLPCKVGDTVYRFQRYFNDATLKSEIKIKPCVVGSFSSESIITTDHVWILVSNFGKTVFPTREEAEKALEDA